jgi:hypothetical protein
MKRLITFSLGVISGLCMIIAMEGRAWGYVDPGTGLVALQTVASVGAACSWFMRKRLQSLFGSKDEEPASKQPASTEAEDDLQKVA